MNTNHKTVPFTLLLLSGKDCPAQSGSYLTMKLSYIPPYGDFTLLKSLELRIRRESLRKTPDTLVLDVSEWLGHEGEEFFEILAKYLHDHRSFRLVFTARAERTEALPLFTALRTYLPGRIEEDRTFAELPALSAYLRETGRLTDKAAAYLAKLILMPEGEPLRSYSVLDSLLCELEDGSADKIHCYRLICAMRDPDSLLGTLFGEKFDFQKEADYGQAV